LSEPERPSSTSLLPTAEILQRWQAASQATLASLSGRLVLAFLGPASSGKDAAIRALFGVDFGDVDPVPGSTTRARVLDLSPSVQVINAPGFGDLRPEVEAEARGILGRLDVAIYLVNADGGATIDERRDLEQLRALGKPVLVCLNKIDLIRPHQRAAFIAATRAQLAVKAEDLVVTAFDPLPALSPEPIGLVEVGAWLSRTLAASGKELLLARHLDDRALAAEPIIHAAARRAALAGAIPVPGADLAAVSAVQVRLITELAAIYGERLAGDVVTFLLAELLAGTGKGFVRWSMGALKAAGWIPGGQLMELATSALGATVAAASTYGVGKATVAFLRQRAQGRAMNGEELRAVFDAEAFRYKDDDRVT